MKKQRFLLIFSTSLCLTSCMPALGQAKIVNGEIAFLHGEDQKLYTFAPATGRMRQLLPGSFNDFPSEPNTEDDLYAEYRKLAWSPDGRWLAYENDILSGEDCLVSAYSIALTEYRCLVPERLLPFKRWQSSEVFTFGWSADGHSLALAYLERMSSRNIKTVIALVNTEGKPTLSKLTTMQRVSVGQLEFSPDNRSIVFSAHKLSGPHWAKKSVKLSSGVYLLDVVTRKVQRFNGTKASDYAPVWSPDGSKLAVLSTPASSGVQEAQITIVDLISASHTQVTNDRLVKESLDWSPDGTAFLFTNVIDSGDLFQNSIYSVQTNGDGLRKLVDANSDTQPVWQPLHVPDDPQPTE